MTIDGWMARVFTSSAEAVENPVLWHSPRILLCNEACVTTSTHQGTPTISFWPDAVRYKLSPSFHTKPPDFHPRSSVLPIVCLADSVKPTTYVLTFNFSSYASIQSVLFYPSSPAGMSILFVSLPSPLFFFGFWVCYWSSGRHHYNGVHDFMLYVHVVWFCGRGVVYRHGKVYGVLLDKLY